MNRRLGCGFDRLAAFVLLPALVLFTAAVMLAALVLFTMSIIPSMSDSMVGAASVPLVVELPVRMDVMLVIVPFMPAVRLPSIGAAERNRPPAQQARHEKQP